MKINKKALSRDEKIGIIKESGGNREHILSILLELQKANEHGEIDAESIQLISEITGIKITRINEIISFYAMLGESSEAEHVIKICRGNPCLQGQEDNIAKILSSLLGINVGERTEDGKFSIGYMPCVGACDIGPVIQVEEELYGDLTKAKLENIIIQLKAVISNQEDEK